MNKSFETCTMKKTGFVYIMPLFMLACDSQIDVVSQEMSKIRQLKSTKTVERPIFHPVPRFKYSAHHLKSPFVPDSLQSKFHLSSRLMRNQQLRLRQPLEQFSLDDLSFKGGFRTQSGKYIGLVQTPDGRLERIQLGSYMGLYQGKVIQINAFQIQLLEMVLDGERGYVTKRRRLLRSVAGSELSNKPISDNPK